MAAFVNPREEVPTSLCCSVTKSCRTLCNPAAHQASLSFTISLSLLKLMSIESVMPSNQLILCHPLLLLPLIFPSIRVFSNESALPIRCPKYWSFIFSPSNEYFTLICFRIDWFDLLTILGTLKSLLQHHHSKASILQCSAFFTVQLSICKFISIVFLIDYILNSKLWGYQIFPSFAHTGY